MSKLKNLIIATSMLAIQSANAAQWIINDNGDFQILNEDPSDGTPRNPAALWDDGPIYNNDYYPDPPAEPNRQSRFLPYEDKVVIPPRITRTEVPWTENQEVGEIIISTSNRKLWHVIAPGRAVQYDVAVGKEGFSWQGTEKVTAMKEWPSWTPPKEMRERNPKLPEHMDGGPANPMGARALYLGNTLYRIHGSNEPYTIGHAVSSGCIRMTNEDVIDLYNSSSKGVKVTVRS
jgi:lipoprotein-anchoring transpeptidase ErfK/SrfK